LKWSYQVKRRKRAVITKRMLKGEKAEGRIWNGRIHDISLSASMGFQQVVAIDFRFLTIPRKI